MLYYRSSRPPSQLPVSSVRLLAAGSLLAYPAGALAVGLTDSLPATLIGYALILAAFGGLIILMTTSLQRIVGEVPSCLDEYELLLRAKAFSAAYILLSGLVLIATIYAALATDFGGWVPRSYEDFSGVFWGIFLYANLLPTLCLSLQLDTVDEAGEA